MIQLVLILDFIVWLYLCSATMDKSLLIGMIVFAIVTDIKDWLLISKVNELQAFKDRMTKPPKAS